MHTADMSTPSTPFRQMADDLEFIERAIPRRDAARASRRALSEYYGGSPEAALRLYGATRVRRRGASALGGRGWSD